MAISLSKSLGEDTKKERSSLKFFLKNFSRELRINKTGIETNAEIQLYFPPPAPPLAEERTNLKIA